MSSSIINKLITSSENDDNIVLNEKIGDLTGQLNACNLKLKDKEFTFQKKSEAFELKINNLMNENKILKDKYEKVNDAQRKFENQNSKLEDRLLNIVEKYEAEQKGLLEDLSIAHSKLVEMKLNLNELEDQKEQFRNDCNVAVNLLQCRPEGFVNHSYNALPINLKDRLKSILTDEEITELRGQHDSEAEYEKKNANSLFKLPIFQPSAAAMMYSMQNQEVLKHQNIESSDHVINLNDSASSLHEDNNRSSNSLDNVIEHQTAIENIHANKGRVSSHLIAKALKNSQDTPSKKEFRQFSYICLRCKKNTMLCDESSQFECDDLNSDGLKIMEPRDSKPKIMKSATIATELASMNETKLMNNENNFIKSSSPDIPGLIVI